MSKSIQTLVIGAGPGGYAAAFRAADLGQQVALVDPLPNPGGVCLHWGCIPTKALLHVVKVKDQARAAAQWGLTYDEPRFDLQKLRAFKDGVIEKLTGGLTQLVRQRGIEHLRGTARLTSAHEARVTLNDGGEQSLRFENAVIATGATPVSLPNVTLDSERILDARSALELKEIPQSLLVIGGGYIGLELGSVFGKLGSTVTVVEMLPGIMSGADRDLVAVFEKQNGGDVFKEILTSTMVDAIEESSGGLKVTMKSADGGNKTSRTETYSSVLMTIGNRPNSADLGLEHAGVRTDDRGFVIVDDQRRTSAGHIFAVGDVTGPPLLAHKANLEGKVAAEVIAGHKSAYDPATIPAVEYTDPEIAWAGITEEQARAQELDVEVTAFPWAASGRALAMGSGVGKTKLVIERQSGRILGIGIVGRDAGELIAEGVLAIEMGAVAEDLALSVHPHPTLSETIMEAAELFAGSATHIYRKKK